MATPVGHSIVGYALARAAGVRSPQGLALSMAAASLPDVDFLLGYVTNGDVYSLHRGVITHKPVFPLLVGAATGAIVAAKALASRRIPSPREVFKPAALATALVASHVAMDPLPLPYDTAPNQSRSFAEAVAGQGWNAVIDMAVYGTLVSMIFERNGANGHQAEA
jgi:hypothetical protein